MPVVLGVWLALNVAAIFISAGGLLPWPHGVFCGYLLTFNAGFLIACVACSIAWTWLINEGRRTS